MLGGVFSRLARFEAQNPILFSISAKILGFGCWDSSRLAPGRFFVWFCRPVGLAALAICVRFGHLGFEPIACCNRALETISQGSNLLPSTHLFVSARLVFLWPGGWTGLLRQPFRVKPMIVCWNQPLAKRLNFYRPEVVVLPLTTWRAVIRTTGRFYAGTGLQKAQRVWRDSNPRP